MPPHFYWTYRKSEATEGSIKNRSHGNGESFGLAGDFAVGQELQLKRRIYGASRRETKK